MTLFDQTICVFRCLTLPQTTQVIPPHISSDSKLEARIVHVNTSCKFPFFVILSITILYLNSQARKVVTRCVHSAALTSKRINDL